MPDQSPAPPNPTTESTADPTHGDKGIAERLTKVEGDVASLKVGLTKVIEQRVDVKKGTFEVKSLNGKIVDFKNAVNGRFDAMGVKFESKFDAVEIRFDALNSRFAALNTDLMLLKLDLMLSTLKLMDLKRASTP
ncbi:MAG: hypothetical protein LBF58_07950 [Deltaproteobacteria bacterium]|nr:hypothetical protein [Deltaproteobacteria bacterium]